MGDMACVSTVLSRNVSHLLLVVVSNLPVLVTQSPPLIILSLILINEPVIFGRAHGRLL
jgi:hypothetical protein